MTNKQTTKVCPDCGCTALVLLHSLNQKICGDCHTVIPWYLEPGQKSIHGNQVGSAPDKIDSDKS